MIIDTSLSVSPFLSSAKAYYVTNYSHISATSIDSRYTDLELFSISCNFVRRVFVLIPAEASIEDWSFITILNSCPPFD